MATRGSSAPSSMGGFQLPSVGGPSSFSPGGLLSNYNANWAASRNSNQDLYDRTSAGFDRVLAGQQADLAGVGAGYRSRQRAVVRGLSGANTANETDIHQQFASLLGNSMQGLADRGLGNSTITSSVERGVGTSMANALTRSRNDFARSIADLRSQWGMAALGQQQQSALANSGLASQQLQALLANTHVGYPDMGAYASMIQAANQQGNGLDSLYGGGAGGGGGLMQFDPSRPVGGYGPHSSAFYTGQATEEPGFAGAPGLGGASFFNPWSGSTMGIGGSTFSSPYAAAVAGGAGGAMGGGGGGWGFDQAAAGGAGGAMGYNDMPVSGASLAQAMPGMGMLATGGNFGSMLTGLANLYG